MQDSIRPTIPTSTILRRSEILAQIAAGKSNNVLLGTRDMGDM
jgi:hypothetical protein